MHSTIHYLPAERGGQHEAGEAELWRTEVGGCDWRLAAFELAAGGPEAEAVRQKAFEISV